VRPARASDEAALVALWDEVEALHARIQPRFFRRTRSGARRLNGRPSAHELVLVAEGAGGAVCGLLHLRLYDTPRAPLLVAERRGHVEDLVVARAQRRSGCGRALLEAGAAWARRQGASQLLLTVWDGNAAAERFYAALGYRRISQVLGTDL
jgi:ribosomal protein S18 acetylase RimI-like enzyme